MAKAYGVYVRFSSTSPGFNLGIYSPVVMHSDHCAEKLLPWFDGMLEADEEYFKVHQSPLFSSHMLDPIGLWLEMEIRITGGEEVGVDNTGADDASFIRKNTISKSATQVPLWAAKTAKLLSSPRRT